MRKEVLKEASRAPGVLRRPSQRRKERLRRMRPDLLKSSKPPLAESKVTCRAPLLIVELPFSARMVA